MYDLLMGSIAAMPFLSTYLRTSIGGTRYAKWNVAEDGFPSFLGSKQKDISCACFQTVYKSKQSYDKKRTMIAFGNKSLVMRQSMFWETPRFLRWNQYQIWSVMAEHKIGIDWRWWDKNFLPRKYTTLCALFSKRNIASVKHICF